MQKRGLVYLVIFVLMISFVSAVDIFTENFGTGTDWTTDLPSGWTSIDGTYSGMDDLFSITGGSDGNRYAWIQGDTTDQHITYSSISTNDFQHLKLSFDYYLFGNFGISSDSLIVYWKLTANSDITANWNSLAKLWQLPGWSHIVLAIPSQAENQQIDLRFMADDTENNDFVFIDNVKITGIDVTQCGNNEINDDEECDDGNSDNNDACRNDCTLNVCGDGVVYTGVEVCDDGNVINDDSCNNNCGIAAPVCSNGIVESPETCELPNTVNNIFCSQSTSECEGHKQKTRDAFGDCDAICGCVLDAFSAPICNPQACGAECDGAEDCPITCNGTKMNNHYQCGTDCLCQGSNPICEKNVCGAACAVTADCPEQQGMTKSCNTNTCACVYIPVTPCGDSIVQAGEQCDDGNANNNDACKNDCTFNYCGDSIVETGVEECDDGNFNNYDACTDSCANAECGDGFVYPPGEECDDGDLQNGDGCSASCVIEGTTICLAPVDVMLLVDRSGSMDDNCPGGQANPGETPCSINDAKTAAITFINQMNFSKDTAGLSSFNAFATLDQAMTSSKTSIIAAINSLAALGQTNIGDGIKVSRLELLANATSSKVLIFLSDGEPNINATSGICVIPGVENSCTDHALYQANLTKLAGVRIFTVGLNVNTFTANLLKRIATSESDYYFAPDSTDLESIYLLIAQEICPCGNGQVDSGEDCDDGNLDNYDSCKNDCTFNECGDSFVYVGNEDCELPSTTNNENCPQFAFDCDDTKSGTRDGFGNCDSLCGCVDDPFQYQCVKNQCGANCSVNPDCNDNNVSTVDECITDSCSCIHYYCGDRIVQGSEECDDGNQNPNDLCSNDCQWTFCGDIFEQFPNGEGTGGPLNDGYEQCDDGNQINTDDCVGSCTDARCGDGFIWTGHETCELPNTVNNAFCPQTPTTNCQGNKLGTRDSLGNCNSACGCVDDPFTNYQCVKGQCTAQCSSDTDCANVPQTQCEGGLSNKTGVRDVFGTCTNDCLCTFDPFVYKCIAGLCGAECNSSTLELCDDHNELTDDYCSPGCACVNIPRPPFGDAKVSQSMPNANFGLGKYMMVNPKTAARDRSYISIDVHSLVGDTITQADLKLWIYYTGGSAAGQLINAYYCPDHAFNEMIITWNNQPMDLLCRIASNTTIPNNVVGGIPETTMTFNLKVVTQEELTSGDGKFTIVLVSAEEGTVADNSKYVQFITKDYPESAYRPVFNPN